MIERTNSEKLIVAGVDIGSTYSKAVILLDRRPVSSSEIRTGLPKDSAINVINDALSKINLSIKDLKYTVATGSGKGHVTFANKTISEISCATAGATNIWGPSVRTVLDAGGINCRVIHCTENGRVINFLWNDKCSSGIGISFDTFSTLIDKNIMELGEISLKYEQFPKLSDFCSIYALSEAFDLIRDKIPIEQIIASYHYAMAKRISVLVERLGLKEDFVLIGGMSKNPGIVGWLKRILKIELLSPKVEFDPSLVVALGAALFADKFSRDII